MEKVKFVTSQKNIGMQDECATTSTISFSKYTNYKGPEEN